MWESPTVRLTSHPSASAERHRCRCVIRVMSQATALRSDHLTANSDLCSGHTVPIQIPSVASTRGSHGNDTPYEHEMTRARRSADRESGAITPEGRVGAREVK